MPPTTDRPKVRDGDLDQAFISLSDEMQRRLLMAIMNENPHDTDEFVTMEFGPDDPEGEPIHLELHHTHLPHLDEAGFVDWNEETGTVTRGEDFAEIRPLFELLDDQRAELPGD